MVRDGGFLTTAAFTDELMKYVITILLMTRVLIAKITLRTAPIQNTYDLFARKLFNHNQTNDPNRKAKSKNIPSPCIPRGDYSST